MKLSNLFGCIFVVCVILAPAARADVIYDLSPQTVGGPDFLGYNQWDGQHYLQKVSFNQTATVTGMAIYGATYVPVGAPTRIDVYGNNPNNTPGASVYQFTKTVEAVDSDGASNGNLRSFASFTTPIIMQPGEVLWFSMAGYNVTLGQGISGYSTGENTLYYFDIFGQAAGFTGGSTSMRLYGTVLPEPTSVAGLGLALTLLARRRRAGL